MMSLPSITSNIINHLYFRYYLDKLLFNNRYQDIDAFEVSLIVKNLLNNQTESKKLGDFFRTRIGEIWLNRPRGNIFCVLARQYIAQKQSWR